MHLSPSTRYGRLANGFLVGFKPHAGFSFPTHPDEFSMIIMENMGVEILRLRSFRVSESDLMGLESCAVRCLKSYRYTWVVVDVFGSNPLWSWKANFATQKEKNMHHSFELPDHPAEKPLESKTTTNKLKKCEQKHFVQLLCLKQYVPPTTKKTWHMFSAYENFQPKHHCQNGWFSLHEPIFT